MTQTDTIQIEKGARKRGLGTFFTLTFALTWGLASLFVLAPDQVERVFGPPGLTNPLYVLAVYAPAISGLLLVWHRLGRTGLRGFFARFAMVRMPIAGWLFLVAGVPALVYAGALITGTAGDGSGFSSWYAAIPALGLAFITGPVEELGWRGVALPLLQRRFNPLVSGVLLGIVWGVWHLPAFALSGTVHSAWAVGPFLAGIVAMSVIMTWLFNASRGSILVAWLMHFQAMNPLFPDAQPWDNLMFVIAAVVIVIANRKSMLGRSDAVVGLVHPVDEQQVSIG